MKILLVEDARSVAAVMEARLTSFGHDVSIAENGQVAFDSWPQPTDWSRYQNKGIQGSGI